MSQSVLERLALAERASELDGKLARADMLVVDDDPNVLRLCETYLSEGRQVAPKGLPLAVHLAATADEALATARGLRGGEGRLMCALIDVVLPGGADGIETCLRLWESDPSIQCVLMTGNGPRVEAEIEERVPPALLPRCDYVSKPFSRFALVHRMRRAAHAWWANWLEDVRRGENIKLVLELGALIDQDVAR